MSSTIVTVVVVIAFFAGAFALSEWLARRTDGASGNDRDPSPG